MQDQSLKKANFILSALLVIMTALLSKVFLVQVLAHDHYKAIKDEQSKTFVDPQDSRMAIYDKNGSVLAYSKQTWSIFADPERISNKRETASKLASVLNLDLNSVLEKLRQETRFVWIKRKVTLKEADALKNIKGIHSKIEYDRIYCHNELASHLLGFVDIDNIGREGTEKTINKLEAEDQPHNVLVDGLRRIIWQESYSEPTPLDVYLTIDLGIQKTVEDELKNALKKHKAQKAICVAIDPTSGHIIAMATLPSFDPNHPANYPPQFRKNSAITDVFECGSTMKPFIIAGALENKIVTPQTILFCENGKYIYEGRTIHDHKSYGNLSVSDIIIHSSNVGAVKIGIMLGIKSSYEYLVKFGFGKKTGNELPAESPGKVPPLSSWSLYTLTSAPIGTEILVTPFQLCRAFGAIANDGNMVAPSTILCVKDHNGNLFYKPYKSEPRKIISDNTIKALKEMLYKVVTKGTAQQAKVDGLTVAGKTGTAQKFDPVTKSYRSGKYTSFFAGFAPVNNPKICLVIIIDEPKGEYYGGLVAAPVAGKILSKIKEKIK